jgi:hypothetical protein
MCEVTLPYTAFNHARPSMKHRVRVPAYRQAGVIRVRKEA